MDTPQHDTRPAPGDCQAYAHTTGAYCVKAADHTRSTDPDVRRHYFDAPRKG